MAPQTPIKLLADKTYTNFSGAGIIPTNNVDATTKLENFASQIIGVLTLVAVIYFIIQIIFAGYSYLSASGDQNKIEKASKQLSNNIMGILIVIVAVGIGSLIAKLLGLNNPLDINTIFTNMGL